MNKILHSILLFATTLFSSVAFAQTPSAETRQEIADMLELEVGTVKSRLNRAREKIKNPINRTNGIDTARKKHKISNTKLIKLIIFYSVSFFLI